MVMIDKANNYMTTLVWLTCLDLNYYLHLKLKSFSFNHASITL